MKKNYLIALLLCTYTALNAQTPCDDTGMAGIYPCEGYTLQSSISLTIFNANSGNDSWGWTDPMDGKEYALMGLSNGTAFIDISDPVNPVYLGKLPTHTTSSEWRDIKVYQNHAFIVSEAFDHGMQVFDLTRLRSVASPPETFTQDAHYDGFGNAHNIVINETEPFAYGVGTNTFAGGAHFVDISDPLNPVAAGGYSADFYTHDAQVITYDGPDTEHVGKEIYIGSNEDQVVVVDVSTKSNPMGLSITSYSNTGYTHQGWFTEDHKYFIIGDELDEVFFGFNTRFIILDMTDLDDPQFFFEYFGTTAASDHNLYVRGDKLYMANYRGGMRVYDISDIENQNITEIGYFDTWPANNNVGASVGDPGAWNVYPFFGSDNIIISNYSDDGGFFLVKDETLLSTSEVNSANFRLLPNPASDTFTITSKEGAINSVAIFDISGKKIFEEDTINVQSKDIDITHFARGMYLVRLNEKQTVKLIKR